MLVMIQITFWIRSENYEAENTNISRRKFIDFLNNPYPRPSRFICNHFIRRSLTSTVTATFVQQPHNQSDLNMERTVF